ncbi:hypothetical protein TcWFU_006014 [Taenia crassiceps]|uniref:Uncharacterized protein n=1 Tax=Taenia crassiceps TaxID=6207 RepID=A0ABR4QBG9_9CEST
MQSLFGGSEVVFQLHNNEENISLRKQQRTRCSSQQTHRFTGLASGASEPVGEEVRRTPKDRSYSEEGRSFNLIINIKTASSSPASPKSDGPSAFAPLPQPSSPTWSAQAFGHTTLSTSDEENAANGRLFAYLLGRLQSLASRSNLPSTAAGECHLVQMQGVSNVWGASFMPPFDQKNFMYTRGLGCLGRALPRQEGIVGSAYSSEQKLPRAPFDWWKQVTAGVESPL